MSGDERTDAVETNQAHVHPRQNEKFERKKNKILNLTFVFLVQLSSVSSSSSATMTTKSMRELEKGWLTIAG